MWFSVIFPIVEILVLLGYLFVVLLPAAILCVFDISKNGKNSR